MGPKVVERSDSLIDSLLSRITDNIVSLLMVNGVSKERFVSFIDDSYSRIQISPEVAIDHDFLPPDYKDIFGTLLAIWRGSSEYVDQTMGDPVDIPLKGGAPSFQALYEQTITRYPQYSKVMQIEDALDLLIKDGCINLRDNRISLERSFVSIHTESLRGPSFLSYLKDLSDTLRRNISESDPDKRRFQRQCNVPDFPIRFIPQLNDKLNSRGMDLLEDIDSIIEELASDQSIDPNEPRVNAGVAVVFFIDDDSHNE